MSIILSCPSCNRKLKGKDEHAGRRMKCPACFAIVTVPDTNTAEASDMLQTETSEKRVQRLENLKRQVINGGISEEEAKRVLSKEIMRTWGDDRHVLEFIIAICNGDTRKMDDLVNRRLVNIDMKNSDGETLMFAAACGGDSGASIEVMKWLSKKRLGVNVKNNRGITPLFICASGSGIDEIKWLLDNGVDINGQDDSGHAALHYLAMTPSTAGIENLLQLNEVVDIKNKYGWTPLVMAVIDNNEAAIRVLKNHKANIEIEDNTGRTPVFFAIEGECIDSLKCLIELGADIASCGEKGLTPMEFAIGYCKTKSIKCLVESAIDINARDTNGRTPIFFACASKKAESMDCLYELGAKLDIKDNTGYTPMSMSANLGNVEAMKWLKGKGVSVIDERVLLGCSLMFAAAVGGQVDAMQWLKEQGLSENDKSDDDRTPMFIAANCCQISAMEWLKDQGADVNFRSNTGWTAMRDAAVSGQLEAMQWLKEHGADVLNDKTDDDATLMHTAARHGHVKVMQWLKNQGVTVNSKNEEGQTPMFRAAVGGHVSVMQWLREQGAEVDIRDNAGCTPASLASEEGHVEAVQWLKEQSTDIGKSVLDPIEVQSAKTEENTPEESNAAEKRKIVKAKNLIIASSREAGYFVEKALEAKISAETIARENDSIVLAKPTIDEADKANNYLLDIIEIARSIENEIPVFRIENLAKNAAEFADNASIAAKNAQNELFKMKSIIEKSSRYTYQEAVKMEQRNDFKKAADLYEKVAKRSDADSHERAKSQEKLASFYYFGDGVEKNWDEAIFWYRKSGERKKELENFGLGLYCYNSIGIARDYDKAITCFRALSGKWYEERKSDYPSDETIFSIERTAEKFENLFFFHGELSDPELDAALDCNDIQKVRGIFDSMNSHIKSYDFPKIHAEMMRYDDTIRDIRIQALSKRFFIIMSMITKYRVVSAGMFQRR